MTGNAVAADRVRLYLNGTRVTSFAASIDPAQGYFGYKVLALAGRDKLTIIASPGIHDLGAWLEQLVAESTGKIGKGVIPVDREPLGTPSAYGSDRIARVTHRAYNRCSKRFSAWPPQAQRF